MRKLRQITGLKVLFFTFAGVLILVAGCGMKKLSPLEENKAIVRRAWEEVINPGDMAAAEELFAADYIYHAAAGVDLQGLEKGVNEPVTMMRNAFPDLNCTVDDMIAEGDKVAHRWSATGTHSGNYLGFEPTDSLIKMTGIVISRIVDGKIVEDWSNGDELGVIQQIGILPPMGRVVFSWGEDMKPTGTQCSPEETRALFDLEIEEVWRRGNVEALGEIIAPGFVNHDPSWPQSIDFESYKLWVSSWIDKAPDMQITIDDIVAEGDRLAVRWTFSWTDEKGIAGFPPTGSKITVTGMEILRCADGRIVEKWWGKDVLGALKQLGVVPRQWNGEDQSLGSEHM
jgi:steroid delta-isomerase-like uncharacterized protein